MIHLFRLFLYLGLQPLCGINFLFSLCSVFKCKLHFSSDFCRGSYRVLKYSGYAGDLSPELAMELLRGNNNAVLIDIRPEARDCYYNCILFG